MLTMRDHGVEDYETLAHMDATDVGDLTDADRACLAELGDYLVTTGAWERFGIWLLHKHFETEAGEVFVERAVHSPRMTQTSPALRSDALKATAIRFEKSAGEGVGIVGMEYAEPGDFGDAAPLSDDDEAVLAGLAQQLQAHDMVDRFGVRLIRNPLGLTEDEMLHETCDSANRTLRCTVGQRSEMLADVNVIQTAWKWRVVEGGVHGVVMQDCTAGCVRVGEGHDIEHTASTTDDQDDPGPGSPNSPF
jgi:hypothetical protein